MRLIKFVLLFLVVLSILSVAAILVFNNTLPKIQGNFSILVLGKGGEGHTAPNLTDTIMLVSLNPDSKKITALSLPRDMWIPAIRAKLNSAYHYGGFEMASQSVNYLTGLEPKFYIVVDFSLFKDLIDSVGGVKVDVANSFTDQKYPITGKENDLCDGDKLYRCRYETVTFEKGIEVMDGETALKFVRSRNAIGDEGTDLAREIRQQKVVEAVKNKLLSGEVIGNPKVIRKLYEVIVTHVETNIDSRLAISIAKFAFESRNNIRFLSIPENFMKISQNDNRYDFQYVFISTSGNWDSLKTWINEAI